jgi:hypothetical protein
MPDLLKTVVPIVISVTALFISLRDRRPRLTLRSRKGDWCKLTGTVNKSEVMFRGLVEVYNVSGRANAIRGYEFWGRRDSGSWEKMESELYRESAAGGPAEKSNQTPLTLAPYSGIEVDVLAFTKMPQPYQMQVRVEVEDLFGKRYRVDVTATS